MSVTFREEERMFWDNWLPKDLGDRLVRIRQLVKDIYCRNEKEDPLIHFTPHGVEHCQAVEDNLHRLIPRELHLKLTEAEKFFLLASAWLHDIGMLRGTFIDDKGHSDDEIRDNHHSRSERYIINNYRQVGVDESEAAAFGYLARFHRRRCLLTTCPEALSIPSHGTLRLRLLAAYVRLADALYIDQTRTPVDQHAISLTYDIPRKSKLHWLRSKFILGLDIDVNNKQIAVHLKSLMNKDPGEGLARRAMKRTLESIHDLIVQDISDELDSVKDVLFGANLTYFLTVRKVEHEVEFDDQLRQDIQSFVNYHKLLNTSTGRLLLTFVSKSLKKNTPVFDLLEQAYPDSVNFSRILELLVLASKKLFSIPEPSSKAASIPVWLRFETQPWATDVSIALRVFEQFSAMIFAYHSVLEEVSQSGSLSGQERKKITSLLGNPVGAIGLEQRIRVQDVIQGSIYFNLGTPPRNIWKKIESLFNFIPLCRKTIAEAKKAEAEAKKIEAEGDKVKAETMIMVLKEKNNIIIKNERERDLSEEREYNRLKNRLNIIKQVLDLTHPEQRHLPEEAVMAFLNSFIDSMDQAIVAEDLGRLVDQPNTAKSERT